MYRQQHLMLSNKQIIINYININQKLMFKIKCTFMYLFQYNTIEKIIPLDIKEIIKALR